MCNFAKPRDYGRVPDIGFRVCRVESGSRNSCCGDYVGDLSIFISLTLIFLSRSDIMEFSYLLSKESRASLV